MLHIHPSVSSVTESRREVALGSNIPSIVLPLPKSTVSETDTIVRVTDGNIVAIGGLMRTEINDVRGGVPGTPDSGALGVIFRSTNRVREKKELVILLKPTIVESDRDWNDDVRETRERVDALGRDMAGKEMR